MNTNRRSADSLVCCIADCQSAHVATLESDALLSIVAPRRTISWRIEPWLESHGYHHEVAPRLQKRRG